MSNPTEKSLAAIKRIGRYLIRRPQAAQLFEWQGMARTLIVYSDSDWGGDKKTRKSTSSGCIMVGSHVLKVWSKRQQVVSLSSMEAELYAGVKAATEAIGVQAMLAEIGMSLEIDMYMDSSSAIALSNKEGLGRAKHIAVQDLWLQDALKLKRLRLNKVSGDENLADLGTKNLCAGKIDYFMRQMGYIFR